MRDPLLVVIAGPTASGKTNLSVELAERLRAAGREAEIIAADSVTVYRGLEIGAAKPSAGERARVPHHLLDVADPTTAFTAGDFTRLARPIVERLQAEGKVPILAGGSGFYLRALLRGMASGDENQEEAATIKRNLEARGAAEGFAGLYRELLSQDPGSVSTVHPNDHYRIVRALQAMALHKKPWSELNKEARATPPAFPGLRFFSLELEKEELFRRIQQRTEAMLEAGLLAEVEGLLKAGVPADGKPLLSVGYAEAVACLRGSLAFERLGEEIEKNTRRLAKSQLTWFRGEELATWLKVPHRENLFTALGL
ncbi:MAG: tRNA (adenosine(37)-N6)-dimethylallyltransferase MiaA [Proteobacteria bacterium]|nr:MAG: tRNA (adenosine(37)-N6)-dimethylallyltransferase MiaA [Pseudomonadota bacterium]